MTPPPAPAAQRPTHATVPADVDRDHIISALTPGRTYAVRETMGDGAWINIQMDNGIIEWFCVQKSPSLDGRDWLLTTEPSPNVAPSLEVVMADLEIAIGALNRATATLRTAIRAARGEG